MGKLTLIEKMEKDIEVFKDNFYNEYGITPFISYMIDKNYIDNAVTLNELKDIANELLPGVMESKNRKKEYVVIRQIIFKIAAESGHSIMKIGKYFNKHHATVIYSKRNINNLIEIKDLIALKHFSNINYEIKKRRKPKGNIQPDYNTAINA
jgi:hypothetical protein